MSIRVSNVFTLSTGGSRSLPIEVVSNLLQPGFRKEIKAKAMITDNKIRLCTINNFMEWVLVFSTLQGRHTIANSLLNQFQDQI